MGITPTSPTPSPSIAAALPGIEGAILPTSVGYREDLLRTLEDGAAVVQFRILGRDENVQGLAQEIHKTFEKCNPPGEHSWFPLNLIEDLLVDGTYNDRDKGGFIGIKKNEALVAVVAYATYPSTRFKDMRGINVERVCTLPEFRNLGYGRALLEEVVGIATKSIGYSGVSLQVKESNKSAIHLYQERLHFQLVDEIPFYYRDGEAALIFRRMTADTDNRVPSNS